MLHVSIAFFFVLKIMVNIDTVRLEDIIVCYCDTPGSCTHAQATRAVFGLSATLNATTDCPDDPPPALQSDNERLPDPNGAPEQPQPSLQLPPPVERQSRKPSRRHASPIDSPDASRSASETRLIGRLLRRHRDALSQPPSAQRSPSTEGRRPQTGVRQHGASSTPTTGSRPNTAPGDQSGDVTDEPDPTLKPLPRLPQPAGYVPKHAASDFSRIMYGADRRSPSEIQSGATSPPESSAKAAGVSAAALDAALKTVQANETAESSTAVNSAPAAAPSEDSGAPVAVDLSPEASADVKPTQDAAQLSDYERFLQQAEEREQAVRSEFMRRVEKATARTRPPRSHTFTAPPLAEIPEAPQNRGRRLTEGMPRRDQLNPLLRRPQLLKRPTMDLRRDSGLSGMDADRRDEDKDDSGIRDRSPGQNVDKKAIVAAAEKAWLVSAANNPGKTSQTRGASKSSITSRMVEYIRPSRLANGYDESAISRA